jgi:hypothetical protein
LCFSDRFASRRLAPFRFGPLSALWSALCPFDWPRTHCQARGRTAVVRRIGFRNGSCGALQLRAAAAARSGGAAAGRAALSDCHLNAASGIRSSRPHVYHAHTTTLPNKICVAQPHCGRTVRDGPAGEARHRLTVQHDRTAVMTHGHAANTHMLLLFALAVFCFLTGGINDWPRGVSTWFDCKDKTSINIDERTRQNVPFCSALHNWRVQLMSECELHLCTVRLRCMVAVAGWWAPHRRAERSQPTRRRSAGGAPHS